VERKCDFLSLTIRLIISLLMSASRVATTVRIDRIRSASITDWVPSAEFLRPLKGWRAAAEILDAAGEFLQKGFGDRTVDKDDFQGGAALSVERQAAAQAFTGGQVEIGDRQKD